MIWGQGWDHRPRESLPELTIFHSEDKNLLLSATGNCQGPCKPQVTRCPSPDGCKDFLFSLNCAVEDSTQWKNIQLNGEHHLNTAFEAIDLIDLLEMQQSISAVLADSTLLKDLGGL